MKELTYWVESCLLQYSRLKAIQNTNPSAFSTLTLLGQTSALDFTGFFGLQGFPCHPLPSDAPAVCHLFTEVASSCQNHVAWWCFPTNFSTASFSYLNLTASEFGKVTYLFKTLATKVVCLLMELRIMSVNTLNSTLE